MTLQQLQNYDFLHVNVGQTFITPPFSMPELVHHVRLHNKFHKPDGLDVCSKRTVRWINIIPIF